MLLIIIILLSVIFLLSYALMVGKLLVDYYKVNCKCSKHLVGKVIIVTGASSGIGYETAKDLADRGGRIILTSITQELADEARDKIIKETENKDVHSYYLDLSSFESVKAFADSILKSEKKIDILINNAGVVYVPNVRTKDGLLLGMQINYFGPFYLTNLLLPLIKASAPSRIINVASAAYSLGKINVDNLNKDSEFISVYQNSKMCLVTMTIELSRRLNGTGVTVNCLHPGFVDTAIMNSTGFTKILDFLKIFAKPYVKSSWEGAQTSIYLAVSSDVKDVSGRYFRDCNPVQVIPYVRDEKWGRLLWEATEKLININQ